VQSERGDILGNAVELDELKLKRVNQISESGWIVPGHQLEASCCLERKSGWVFGTISYWLIRAA
jgi:hypothetical protein